MSEQHMQVPGNVITSQMSRNILEAELLQYNILSFPWPQELDSGIDMVGFATVPTSNQKIATAFVAGFQSRGFNGSERTNHLETSKEIKKEGDANGDQRISIGKHGSYWTNSTMPVFVAAIDASTREIWIEDAAPGIEKAKQDQFRSILASTKLEEAVIDIRLRMFANALAPWVAHRLRSRTISALPSGTGITRASTWSLLGWAIAYEASLTPRTWTECSQYFNLINWLHTGREEINQFKSDIESPPVNSYHANVFSVLMHVVEMYAHYGFLRSSMPDGAEADRNLLLAEGVIQRLWESACSVRNLSTADLALQVQNHSPILKASQESESLPPTTADTMIDRLILGEPLIDLIRESYAATKAGI